MLVPDEIRKCVAFVGYQMADGRFLFAGTVFFLARDTLKETDPIVVYAVTAKHVIDKIKAAGLEHVFLRFNNKNGNAQWFSTFARDWTSHPTDESIDVSILETHIPSVMDHLVIPYSLCITDEIMKENNAGVGDEVFITGLFRRHTGSKRNIPIVRIGNIACLTEERVSTKLGEIVALLIEARSIGGISGSPVFLNLGSVRVINGTLNFAAQKPRLYLLGLIHGHYDVPEGDIDTSPDGLSSDNINTGMAIVVPFHSIDSVITLHEAAKRS